MTGFIKIRENHKCHKYQCIAIDYDQQYIFKWQWASDGFNLFYTCTYNNIFL